MPPRIPYLDKRLAKERLESWVQSTTISLIKNCKGCLVGEKRVQRCASAAIADAVVAGLDRINPDAHAYNIDGKIFSVHYTCIDTGQVILTLYCIRFA